MVSFGQILGVEKTMILTEASSKAAKPVTVTSSGVDEIGVSSKELENTYRFDPITFNSINKSVQTIMGAGSLLEAKSKKVEKFYKKFLSDLGSIGEPTTYNELMYSIYQNKFIYGRHYIEIIYNENMSSIVDLKTLDPKGMDYARDSQRKIVLDDIGRPVGYTQTVPYGVDAASAGDLVPNEVTLNSQQIFLKPERIAHFKLYTYGDRFNSIGLIEPAYKSIIRRQNIEEAQANSIYARGTYPVIDYIGDENHFPTPNMIKAATEKLKLLQHNRYFAVPYWHNIKPLEVKQSEVVDNTLKYLRDNATASLGLPMALATGSGESTNRATLSNQQKFLENSLKDTVKRTLAEFRNQIFRKISKLEGFDEVPRIIWGDINVEDKDDKAKRLVAYTNNKVGILRPDDARAYAINSEGLKLFDEFSQELSKKENDYNEEMDKLKESLDAQQKKIDLKIQERENLGHQIEDINKKLRKKVEDVVGREKEKESLARDLRKLKSEKEEVSEQRIRIKENKEEINKEKEAIKKEIIDLNKKKDRLEFERLYSEKEKDSLLEDHKEEKKKFEKFVKDNEKKKEKEIEKLSDIKTGKALFTCEDIENELNLIWSLE